MTMPSSGRQAVRLTVAKQRPLVAILPVGGGKSLIFMAPTVPPYAELKKQPVTRCNDDYKYWLPGPG
jgi:hypothetical protein